MACPWLKKSQSLNKGLSIVNQLDEGKFDQFLRRIVTKLKSQNPEIFTEEERQKLEIIFKLNEESLFLAIKTIVYLFKRMLKFIFMPANLKQDLKDMGLDSEKAEVFVKVWSSETRYTLDELGSENVNESSDSISFPWKVSAELSSDIHKKCKVPKTYFSIVTEKDNLNLELTHQEVHSVFLQIESIQNDLDNLM